MQADTSELEEFDMTYQLDAKIRFVLRDGKKILQMATHATMKDGEVVYAWADVPLVEAE